MIKIGEMLVIDLASILTAAATLTAAMAAFVVGVAKTKNRQRKTKDEE